MDPNPFAALIAALSGTALAPLAVYVPLLVAVAAMLAAVLPQPAPDSPWVPLRKLLDLAAMNVGAAKNLPSHADTSPTKEPSP